jgi:hypothetical protein
MEMLTELEVCSILGNLVRAVKWWVTVVVLLCDWTSPQHVSESKVLICAVIIVMCKGTSLDMTNYCILGIRIPSRVNSKHVWQVDCGFP